MSSVQLTESQLHYLLGIGTVVSKDTARPTLTGVQLQIRSQEKQLVAVATDSYRLAVIRLNNVEVEGADQEWFVPFKQLEAAAKFAKQKHGFEYGTRIVDRRTFRLRIEEGFVNRGGTVENVVVGVEPEKGRDNTAIHIQCMDATFPNWKQLFRGQSWWGSELIHNSSGREVYDGMRLPSLNSAYLNDLPRLLGGGRSHRLQMVTLNHTATDGESAELKPWLFGAVDMIPANVEIAYLLMPVTDAMWTKASS